MKKKITIDALARMTQDEFSRVGERLDNIETHFETRFDKLDSEVKRRGMDVKPIQWLLDLRKSGSANHCGAGLGVARLFALVSGVPSVRDAVFLPVYYGHCPY